MDPQVPTITPIPEPVEPPPPVNAPAQIHSIFVPILSILLFIFLVSTALLYFQNLNLKKEISATPTALPVVTATPDVTASWKPYDNITYNYSIKYPANFAVNENGMGGGDIQKASAISISEAVVKKVETPTFAITIRAEAGETLKDVANKHYQALLVNQLTEADKQAAEKNLGFVWNDDNIIDPIKSDPFLNFPSFEYAISGSKVNDGAAEYGVPTETHKYIWFEKDKRFILISFTETPIMDQILSTFKFSTVIPSPSPKPSNLLSTAGWQNAENSNFSIKYPADKYTVVTNPQDIQLTEVGKTTVGPEFLLFTGNSDTLQNWYLNYYSYSASEVGKNIFFKQKVIGNLNILVVSPNSDPSYVQDIVVSKGSNIVDLRTQDPNLELMETLVSTLVFK